LDGLNLDNSFNKIFTPEYLPVVAVTNENGKIWVLGRNWVGWIEKGKIKILNDKFEFPSALEFESPKLIPGKNNILYVGNYYFSFYINKLTGKLYPMTHKNGFASDGGTSIFLDKEENVWITGMRGIDKLSNLFLQNYDVSNGLLDNEVTAICEYSSGKLILGHNEGISIFTNGKIDKIDFPHGRNIYSGSNRVLDLCKAKDGTIWIAASALGLGKMDINGNLSWIKIPNSYSATSVNIDKNGKLWVAANSGIYSIQNGKVDEEKEFNNNNHFFRRINITKDNEIYFSSAYGIKCKIDNKVSSITSTENIGANEVFNVYKDNKNRIFAGTKVGLYIIQNKSLIKFSENGFIIDKAVYTITQDTRGNYWFGTNDGVIKWDGNKYVQTFTTGNGLLGKDVNRAALSQDSFGNMWIGTESGMTCYKPEYDNNVTPVPEILFVNVEDIEGNKYSLTKNLNLPNKTNTLYFNFRGISFINEDLIKYKIKLEGFDADWYEVNQSQIDKIRYTNLKPGDYKLLVSAKNVSGDWSKAVSSPVITIQTPFYVKLWFVLLIITIFLLLLYLFYKLSLKRLYFLKLEEQVQLRTSELKESENELRKSHAELEEKVKERTNELAKANEQLSEMVASKDKFFSIIAHDMKSSFSGLLGYTEVLKVGADSMTHQEISDYSDNLHKHSQNSFNLLENLLNWSMLQTGRMDFIPIKFDLYQEIQFVLDLVEANALSKNINISNDVKEFTFVRADENMLRTVLYNLVTNAIKFTFKGGEVKISSDEKDGFIIISVSNNGVIISEEDIGKLFKLTTKIKTEGTSKEKGTGLGLLICKEMIDKHNGKITVESSEDKGTTFCVWLPV